MDALEIRFFKYVDTLESAADIVIRDLHLDPCKLAEIMKFMDKVCMCLDSKEVNNVTMSDAISLASECPLMRDWRSEVILPVDCDRDKVTIALLLMCWQYTHHVTKYVEEKKSFLLEFDQKETINEEKKREGNEAFKQKNYNMAVSCYSSALQMSRFSHILYGNRACAYIKLEQFEAALSDARRAIVLVPRYAKGQLRYCEALMALGHESQAKAVLDKAIELCPDDKVLHDKLKDFEEDASCKAAAGCNKSGKNSEINNNSKRGENKSDESNKQRDGLQTPATANGMDSSDESVPELVDSSGSSDGESDNDEIKQSNVDKKVPLKTSAMESKPKQTKAPALKPTPQKPVNKPTPRNSYQTPAIHVADNANTCSMSTNMMDSVVMQKQILSLTLMDSLMEGTAGYLSNNPEKAIDCYQTALNTISKYTLKDFSRDLKEEQYIVVKYAIGCAYLKIEKPQSIRAGLGWFEDIEKMHKKAKFPLAYLGMGRAYYQLMRFAESLVFLERGKTIVTSRRSWLDHQIQWPASSSVIEETRKGKLLQFFKELIDNCKFAPKPDAVCRYSQCRTPKRIHIYIAEPEFEGFIRLQCFAACCIEFHVDCWKLWKTELLGKLSDKDVVTRTCTTPDCGARFCSVNIYNKNGVMHKNWINIHSDTPLKKKGIVKKTLAGERTMARRAVKKEARKQLRKQRREPAGQDQIGALMEAVEQGANAAAHAAAKSVSGQDESNGLDFQKYATVLKKEETSEKEQYKVSGKTSKGKSKKQKPNSVISLDEFVGVPPGFEEQQQYKMVDPIMRSPPAPGSAMGIDDFDIPRRSASKTYDAENPFTVPPSLRQEVADFESHYSWSSTPTRDSQHVASPDIFKPRMVDMDVVMAHRNKAGARQVGKDPSSSSSSSSSTGSSSRSAADAVRNRTRSRSPVVSDHVETDSNPDVKTLGIKETIFEMFSAVLRKHGPLHIDNPIVTEELDNFPMEAKAVVAKAGGIGKVLKQSLMFNVYEDFMCLMADAVKARKLAEEHKKAQRDTLRQEMLKKMAMKKAGKAKKSHKPNSEYPLMLPRGDAKFASEEDFRSESESIASLDSDFSIGSSASGCKSKSVALGDEAREKISVSLSSIAGSLNTAAVASFSVKSETRLSPIKSYFGSVESTASAAVPILANSLPPASNEVSLTNSTLGSHLSGRMSILTKPEIQMENPPSVQRHFGPFSAPGIKHNFKENIDGNILHNNSDEKPYFEMANNKSGELDGNGKDEEKATTFDDLWDDPLASNGYLEHGVNIPNSLSETDNALAKGLLNNVTDGLQMSRNNVCAPAMPSMPSIHHLSCTENALPPALPPMPPGLLGKDHWSSSSKSSVDSPSPIESTPELWGVPSSWSRTGGIQGPPLNVSSPPASVPKPQIVPSPSVASKRIPPGLLSNSSRTIQPSNKDPVWSGSGKAPSNAAPGSPLHGSVFSEKSSWKPQLAPSATAPAPWPQGNMMSFGSIWSSNPSSATITPTDTPSLGSPLSATPSSHSSSIVGEPLPMVSHLPGNEPSLEELVDYDNKKFAHEMGVSIHQDLQKSVIFQDVPLENIVDDINSDLRRVSGLPPTGPFCPSIPPPCSVGPVGAPIAHFPHSVACQTEQPVTRDSACNTAHFETYQLPYEEAMGSCQYLKVQVQDMQDQLACQQEGARTEISLLQTQVVESQRECQNIASLHHKAMDEVGGEKKSWMEEKSAMVKETTMLVQKLNSKHQDTEMLIKKLQEGEQQVLFLNQELHTLKAEQEGSLQLQEERNLLIQHEKEQTVRAQNAEVMLLELKMEVGHQILERSFKDAQKFSHQYLTYTQRLKDDGVQVPQAFQEASDKWKATADTICEKMKSSREAFDMQIRKLRQGEPLSSLAILPIPRPPPPPEIHIPPHMLGMGRTGNTGPAHQMMQPKLNNPGPQKPLPGPNLQQAHMISPKAATMATKPNPPAAMDRLEDDYSTRFPKTGGAVSATMISPPTGAVPGHDGGWIKAKSKNTNSGKSPAEAMSFSAQMRCADGLPSLNIAQVVAAGTRNPAESNKKSKSGFEKIMNSLGSMFPNYQRTEINKFIEDLRQSRNNSLSGLTLQEIVTHVAEMIFRDTSQRMTQDKHKVQPFTTNTKAPTGSDTLWSAGNTNQSAEEIFEEEEDPCIICHDELTPISTCTLECKHRYHKECIQMWFREQRTCPTCRTHTLLQDEYPALH